MPIQEFDELESDFHNPYTGQKLRNFWGYSTVGFFAPKAGYAATGALEAHDLRTRHAGPRTFIDFHLVVDGQTTVDAAHDICDRIEQALKARLPGAMITIHVEPEHKAKHSGVLVI